MRPIDADALFHKLSRIAVTDDVFGMGVADGIAKAMAAILEAPTIMGIHAKWHKLAETKLTKTVECTHCNFSVRYNKEREVQFDKAPYCPNCGARMDGEDNAQTEALP